jgi:hypothetical protein
MWHVLFIDGHAFFYWNMNVHFIYRQAIRLRITDNLKISYICITRRTNNFTYDEIRKHSVEYLASFV